eukprot:5849108-Pyramimonas_sp.AAC.1
MPDLKKVIHRGVRRQQEQAAAAHLGWHGFAFLDPVKAELRHLRGKGEFVQADLVALHMSEGLWTQDKLYHERFTIDRTCQ